MFEDPTTAEAAFYAAFRALDDKRMRSVWSDSATTSCIHPGGGLIRGTGAIIESWRTIFRGSRAPRLAYRLLGTNADGHLAVHTVEEEIAGASGRGAVVLATNVYGRFDDGWRMLAHHASLPLVEPDEAQAGRAPLH
jgi:hypothetical protein